MSDLELIKISLKPALALFRGDRKGVTALEYGLIAAGIAVAIIAAVKGLGTTLSTKFNFIGSSIGSGS